MNSSTVRQLKNKLILLYIYIGAAVLLLYIFQGVYVTNVSWLEVIKYHLPAQLSLIAVATMINYLYTRKNLYPLLLQTINAYELPRSARFVIFQNMVSFPQRLFWLLFLLYPIIILLKYIYEMTVVVDFTYSNLLLVFMKYLSSSSLIFLYAQTITIYVKKYLRPALISLDMQDYPESKGTLTFKRSITMAGIFLFAIYFINIFVYNYFGAQGNIMVNILVLTVITFLVFIGFLRILIFEHIEHLRVISKEMIHIQIQDRKDLHKQIPVTTLDEIGMLTFSYNKIQNKIKKLYNEIDEDLELAQKVQNYLVPPVSYEDDVIRVAAYNKPAREVGGDFYDFVQVSSGKYITMIGDVTGKGITASLLVSMIIGNFRAKANVNTTVEQLAHELNNILVPFSENGLFVTCGIGILDANVALFTYVSAGHLPPILINKAGLAYIESSCFPLGVTEELNVNMLRIPLTEGDKIVLYTDGIIEQTNDLGEQFGFKRFESLLADSEGDADPKELISTVIAQHAPGSTISDDVTVLMLTYKNASRGVGS